MHTIRLDISNDVFDKVMFLLENLPKDKISVEVESLKSDNQTWYIADIVVEISIEDKIDNTVHVNTRLIQASSDEDAYQKAIKLGKEDELITYKNPEGKLISTTFLGLDNLDLIDEDLAHGSELYFKEYINIPKKELHKYIRNKEELSVFKEIIPSKGIDYSSGEIMEAYDKFQKEQ